MLEAEWVPTNRHPKGANEKPLGPIKVLEGI